MKLVGKKLYRIGSLKLFKNGWGSVGNRGRGAEASGGGGGNRGGNRSSGPSAADIRRRREAAEARAAAAKAAREAAERKRIADEKERKRIKGVFSKDIEGTGKQSEARQMQQEAINRMRSGETGRVSREAALAGLVGSQAAGGVGSKRMLQQQASGISRKAATEALGTTKDVVSMGGQMRLSDIGLSKADKSARMKGEQLMMGERLAREGMKAQVDAARAGASGGGGGGKSSGGEIFNKYAKGGYNKKSGKIEGVGTETSDSIKARLSDGEFVVNAATVKGLGKLIGGKSKEDQRAKGSSLLYKIQAKYGKESDKDRNLAVGGSAISGADMAKWAGQLAGTGILGKGAQVAGKAVSAGVAGKEAADEAAKTKVTKKQGESDMKLKRDFWKSQISKSKPKEVSPGPEAVGIRETKSIMKKPARMDVAAREKTEKAELQQLKMGEELARKKGGDVKLGKGVKAKKKFLEAVGYEPSKHFEKKALKDYKEGHTGYKNYKGEKSSVPGYFIGAEIAVPAAISIAGSLFGASSAAKQRKAQAQQQKSLAEQEAGKSLSRAGESIMKADTTLKSGGSVIDRPKLNVEKLSREPLGKEYRLPEHGEDIHIPLRKKLEPRATKKPPLWMRKKEKPIKMEKGGDWRKVITNKISKKYGHVLNKQALRKRINQAIKNEANFREGAKGTKSRWSPEKIKALEAQYKFKQGAPLRKFKAASKKSSKDYEEKKEEDKKIHGAKVERAEYKRQKKSEVGDARGLERIGTEEMKKQKEVLLDHLSKAVSKYDEDKKGPDPRGYLKKYFKSDAPQFTRKEFSKALQGEKDFRKGAKDVSSRWSPQHIKSMKKYYGDKAKKEIKEDVEKEEVKRAGKVSRESKKLSPIRVGTGREDVEMRDVRDKKEFGRSLKNPKARAFLAKQGLIPHEKMSFKEKFAQRARKRDEQDEKEAKQYEKKEGFFSKLGDRFTSGEWFGSSKDILAAKRREKDKEQAKRERSGEDFEKKKAAQDDKIAMAKEMAAERKKGIEAKGIRETKSIMKRPKPPVVAPKSPVVAPKVPGVKTKEAPEVKPKKGDMTSKDWATMGVAGATSLLGSIAASKKAKADRKRARETEIRRARQSAGKSLSSFGQSVMGMDTRLKGGGKVSFKDVLKAKKKMGY
jgi:uncharacterized phage-like protein YoqJ